MEKIFLDGAKNVRDLGNTKTKDGKIIKRKRYIRSNKLVNLSEADKKKLKDEYDLSLIIDLRTSREIEEKPDPVIEGVEWLHMPIIRMTRAGISHEKEERKSNPDPSKIPDMRNLYVEFVEEDYCIEMFKKTIHTILNHKSGSVLWHCSEGKDRCGMVSVFMEYILGVDTDDIMEDYLETNVYSIPESKKEQKRVLADTGNEELAEKVGRLIIADRSYLQAALDYVDKNYGGMDNFIKEKLMVTSDMVPEVFE
ncbi:MAG: tyrosine-protein phosphatase [Lachnospiraceae bacterium]|jgi:protein-tyrosine phosphatase|nr:tyrosine-protein phosphatase [Lachnospiraceae bacterium]